MEQEKYKDEEEFLDRHFQYLEFIEDVEDYRCVRCRKVMVHYFASDCGHKFCRQCKRIVGDGLSFRRCPRCSKPITKIKESIDVEFSRRVVSLKVMCANKGRKCNYTRSLKDTAEHAKSCLYLKTENSENIQRCDEKVKEAITTGLQCPKKKFNEIPGKTYNIFLLGETGVGKSTFINAMANYIKHTSLENAKKAILDVLIPYKFTVWDKNSKPVNVQCGEDSNENPDSIDKSSTKRCKVHVLKINNFSLRIIDTPGIGDPSGTGCDSHELHHEDVAEHFSAREALHVCILMKPHQTRLSPNYYFWLKQILTYSTPNRQIHIVFVFTNSRATFYRPADTLIPLKNLLKKIEDDFPHVQIPFGPQNVFCIDNEGFLYLAAARENVKLFEDVVIKLSQSWIKSSVTCDRLIRCILNTEDRVNAYEEFTDQQLNELVAMETARNAIQDLSLPVAETVKLIQTLLLIFKEQKKELDNYPNDVTQVNYILSLPSIAFTFGTRKAVNVCASEKCGKRFRIGKVDVYHFRMKCHDPCDCRGKIGTDKNEEERMKCCEVIDRKTNDCRKCGCSYKEHKIVYYETTEEATIIHKFPQKSDLIASFVGNINCNVTKWEREVKILNENMARVEMYLEQNRVKVDDSYRKSVEKLVEKRELDGTFDYNTYFINERLEVMLGEYDKYKSEVKIPIKPEEVKEIVNKLSNMQYSTSIKPFSSDADIKTIY